MRLQLVVSLALVSSALAQRNPIRTSGAMPRSGAPSTGGNRPVGPSTPGALPPGSLSGPGRMNGGRPNVAYGAAYGALYDSDADGFYSSDAGFDVPDGYIDDGFYSHRPPREQPEMPLPTVIINEGFRIDPIHPQLRDYTNVKLPEPGTVLYPPSTATAGPTEPPPVLADAQPPIFLIALQDHVILPALAYWVQGNTLHYISLDGVSTQMKLTWVDHYCSQQLNWERHVPFALPTVK